MLKVKIDQPHSKECIKQRKAEGVTDPMIYLNTYDLELMVEYRTPTGRRHKLAYLPWLVWRCNWLSSCPCRILVRVDTIEQAVAQAVAEQGKE